MSIFQSTDARKKRVIGFVVLFVSIVLPASILASGLVELATDSRCNQNSEAMCEFAEGIEQMMVLGLVIVVLGIGMIVGAIGTLATKKREGEQFNFWRALFLFTAISLILFVALLSYA